MRGIWIPKDGFPRSFYENFEQQQNLLCGGYCFVILLGMFSYRASFADEFGEEPSNKRRVKPCTCRYVRICSDLDRILCEVSISPRAYANSDICVSVVPSIRQIFCVSVSIVRHKSQINTCFHLRIRYLFHSYRRVLKPRRHRYAGAWAGANASLH